VYTYTTDSTQCLTHQLRLHAEQYLTRVTWLNGTHLAVDILDRLQQQRDCLVVSAVTGDVVGRVLRETSNTWCVTVCVRVFVCV
jgi:aminoglycoside phosphotransferase